MHVLGCTSSGFGQDFGALSPIMFLSSSMFICASCLLHTMPMWWCWHININFRVTHFDNSCTLVVVCATISLPPLKSWQLHTLKIGAHISLVIMDYGMCDIPPSPTGKLTKFTIWPIFFWTILRMYWPVNLGYYRGIMSSLQPGCLSIDYNTLMVCVTPIGGIY